MRALVQRVSRAEVRVADERVGAIGRGLLVFVGLQPGDGVAEIAWLKRKLGTMRVFADAAGKTNLSLSDVAGSLLVVSQFTLCADLSRGTRPSFTGAMAPAEARPLWERLLASFREELPVETGTFGAQMEVELVNDGPLTLWLSSEERP